MSSIIPAPLRDIFMAPSQITSFRDSLRGFIGDCPEVAIPGMFGNKLYTHSLANKMISASLRVTLAASGSLALYTLGYDIPVSAVLTGCISLPALSISSGSALVYYGVAACVDSLTSGCFTTLGTGLACTASGWLLLENYAIAPIGIAEHFFIEPVSHDLTMPLLKLFN